MHFILPAPSLEHRSLVTIAVTLWTQRDIRDRIPKNSRSLEFRWPEVDVIVAEKVSKLPLPAILNEKLLVITEQVGLEILSWMKCHTDAELHPNQYVTKLPDIFVWTPHGTINNKKTAEAFVKDEAINVEQRFMLASTYCLQDDILDLRRKFKLSRDIIYHDDFSIFWSNYSKKHTEKKMAYYNRAKHKKLFDCAAQTTFNEAATRYFFLKLRDQKNETDLKATVAGTLKRLITRNYFVSQRKNDVICFLLSIIDAEQQTEIFQSHTYELLNSLLVWPWQSLFLEMAQDKWNFLSKERYADLLYNIVQNMSCENSYLEKLFLEFWQETPQTYKQFVIDGYYVGSLFINLYKKDKERIIKVILNDLSISARKKLIFSEGGLHICELLGSCEQWDSVEYIIQECISSPEEIREFKEKFRDLKDSDCWKYESLRSKLQHNLSEDQYNKGLQMIEDFIIIYRKRKIMEDNTESSKKVRGEDI